MLAEPKCYTRKCRHFIGPIGSEEDRNERVACKAFTNGIPVEIAYGENRHMTPFKGDQGIRYEPGLDE